MLSCQKNHLPSNPASCAGALNIFELESCRSANPTLCQRTLEFLLGMSQYLEPATSCSFGFNACSQIFHQLNSWGRSKVVPRIASKLIVDVWKRRSLTVLLSEVSHLLRYIISYLNHVSILSLMIPAVLWVFVP